MQFSLICIWYSTSFHVLPQEVSILWNGQAINHSTIRNPVFQLRNKSIIMFVFLRYLWQCIMQIRQFNPFFDWFLTIRSALSLFRNDFNAMARIYNFDFTYNTEMHWGKFYSRLLGKLFHLVTFNFSDSHELFSFFFSRKNYLIYTRTKIFILPHLPTQSNLDSLVDTWDDGLNRTVMSLIYFSWG